MTRNLESSFRLRNRVRSFQSLLGTLPVPGTAGLAPGKSPCAGVWTGAAPNKD
jgi:hypothetical protein